MGLSGGAIAGIVIGAVVVVAGILLVTLWALSGSNNSKTGSRKIANNGTSSDSVNESMRGNDSKKYGDKFFSNLVPSFLIRDQQQSQ